MGEFRVVSIEEALRRFNRKERFIVAEWLLAPAPFALGRDTREELARVLHARGVSAVPPDAFVAIDYHLDWLYAALSIHTGHWDADDGAVHERPPEPALTANQEDVDAIVAWSPPEGGATILLIEAKAYSGWTNKQLQSKANRLGAIFGPDGDNWKAVTPHFVLAGPKPSQGVDDSTWPRWMRPPATIDLPTPTGQRSAVTRCDDDGRPAATGDRIRITPSTWPNAPKP